MTPTGNRSRTVSESQTTANVTTPLTNVDYSEVTIIDENLEGERLPDVVAESRFCANDEPYESYLAITIQVFIPFLVAGLGMVGAGLVLDVVQVRTQIIIYLNDMKQ